MGKKILVWLIVIAMGGAIPVYKPEIFLGMAVGMTMATPVLVIVAMRDRLL